MRIIQLHIVVYAAFVRHRRCDDPVDVGSLLQELRRGLEICIGYRSTEVQVELAGCVHMLPLRQQVYGIERFANFSRHEGEAFSCHAIESGGNDR